MLFMVVRVPENKVNLYGDHVLEENFDATSNMMLLFGNQSTRLEKTFLLDHVPVLWTNCNICQGRGNP